MRNFQKLKTMKIARKIRSFLLRHLDETPSAPSETASPITDLTHRITNVVRRADRTFETTGGSGRHWVIECFLPQLEAEGLTIKEIE